MVLGPDIGNESVHTRGDLFRRLASRAAIPPDVPMFIQTLLLPQLADLGARDALVVAIIPFADVFSDLDARIAGRTWGV